MRIGVNTVVRSATRVFYALRPSGSVRHSTDLHGMAPHAAHTGLTAMTTRKKLPMHHAFTFRTLPFSLSSRPQVTRVTGLTLLTALVAFTLMACATKIPAPTQEIALSRAAIEAATRAGAAELAPAELTIARQKQAMADTAMSQEQFDRALLLSNEVQVDARFAEARARSNRANKAAGEIREDGRVLRQEINRAQ